MPLFPTAKAHLRLEERTRRLKMTLPRSLARPLQKRAWSVPIKPRRRAQMREECNPGSDPFNSRGSTCWSYDWASGSEQLKLICLFYFLFFAYSEMYKFTIWLRLNLKWHRYWYQQGLGILTTHRLASNRRQWHEASKLGLAGTIIL